MSEAPRPSSLSPIVYRVQLALAKLVLLWEQVWPALWPATVLAAAFVAAALFGLFAKLPWWLHLAVLVVVVAGLLALLYRGLRTIRWPARIGARRHLETTAGVDHRPLTALEDRLATGDDSMMVLLWREHQRRMLERAALARAGWPKAGWGRHADPWGLRAIVALMLVLGFFYAGSDWHRRIAVAAKPDFASGRPTAAAYDAWITPPAYAGLAPIFLRPDTHGSEITVPTGSVLVARIHGVRRAPELRIDGTRTAFAAIDRNSFEVEHTITDGLSLAFQQGARTIGTWKLSVIPDRPPTIEFSDQPGTSARDALRLSYAAKDDYGLAKISAVMKRLDSDESVTIDLPLGSAGAPEAAESSYHDLTPHPWAGLPVTIQLVAVDEIGQEGKSEEAETVLPERKFHHPIAKAIVEQRKVLALAPHRRESVARALARVSADPKRYYEDTTAFLVLRVAVARLIRGSQTPETTTESATEVVDMLWSAALRIEDGNVSLAEAELRAAQDRLLDALSRNAADDEIEQRIAEVRDALDKFLRALAERALQNRQLGELMPKNMPPNSLIDSEQLKKLLDRALDLNRTGSKEAARELLAQLRDLLENLRDGLMQGDMMSGMPGEELLQALNDLMRMQQELLDEAFRDSQQRGGPQQGAGQEGQRGRGNQPGQGNPGSPGDRQENLRRMLGEIMRRLGEGGADIPNAFGKADRNMNDARGELEARRPGSAVGPMTEALDALRQGANAVIRDMLEAMGVDPGLDPSSSSPFTRVGRDPLGRPQSGFGIFDDERIAIPEESEVQRARDILRELHRRAGERTRSKVEIDYIERLLKRF
ncbi:MAG: TIGR02302 family protein [Alphaproteobacteria bacterium]|nr:TIGR02302 family protein [Alphaproteobacteria bacterium]